MEKRPAPAGQPDRRTGQMQEKAGQPGLVQIVQGPSQHELVQVRRPEAGPDQETHRLALEIGGRQVQGAAHKPQPVQHQDQHRLSHGDPPRGSRGNQAVEDLDQPDPAGRARHQAQVVHAPDL